MLDCCAENCGEIEDLFPELNLFSHRLAKSPNRGIFLKCGVHRSHFTRSHLLLHVQISEFYSIALSTGCTLSMAEMKWGIFLCSVAVHHSTLNGMAATMQRFVQRAPHNITKRKEINYALNISNEHS
jgi:hypothetical protein